MLWNDLEFAEITASRHMAMEVAYAVMKTRGQLVGFSADIFDDNTVVIHLDANNYCTCRWGDHKYTIEHNHFPNDDYDCEPINKIVYEGGYMESAVTTVTGLVIKYDSSIESIIRRAIKK